MAADSEVSVDVVDHGRAPVTSAQIAGCFALLMPAFVTAQPIAADRLNNLASSIEALVGVTLKPWRVELELMRLTEFIANRHPDVRQSLLV